MAEREGEAPGGSMVVLRCCDQAVCDRVLEQMSAASAVDHRKAEVDIGRRSVRRTGSGDGTGAREEWEIDNRYYTVKLDVHTVGADDWTESASELLHSADVLLVLLDAHDEGSVRAAELRLDDVREWYGRDRDRDHEDRGISPAWAALDRVLSSDPADGDGFCAEERLVVGVISDCSPAARVPPSLRRWEEVFAEFLGYREFLLAVSRAVDADAGADRVTEAELHRLFEASGLGPEAWANREQYEDDLMGKFEDCICPEPFFDPGSVFRQMSQAIQCVQWPGLVRKDVSDEVIMDPRGAAAPVDGAPAGARAAPDAAPDGPGPSSPGAREEVAEEALEGEEVEEEALEREMAEFEKMMAAVTQARADALAADDLNGGGGDGEITEGTRRRREIAAEVATRMLEQFGLGDADDD